MISGPNMWSCYVIFTHHGKKFKNGRIFNRFQRGAKITGLFQNPGIITSATWATVSTWMGAHLRVGRGSCSYKYCIIPEVEIRCIHCTMYNVQDIVHSLQYSIQYTTVHL